MDWNLSFHVPLAQSHVGRGYAQYAGLNPLGALNDGTQGAFSSTGSGEAVAITSIVQDDDSIGRAG